MKLPQIDFSILKEKRDKKRNYITNERIQELLLFLVILDKSEGISLRNIDFFLKLEHYIDLDNGTEIQKYSSLINKLKSANLIKTKIDNSISGKEIADKTIISINKELFGVILDDIFKNYSKNFQNILRINDDEKLINKESKSYKENNNQKHIQTKMDKDIIELNSEKIEKKKMELRLKNKKDMTGWSSEKKNDYLKKFEEKNNEILLKYTNKLYTETKEKIRKLKIFSSAYAFRSIVELRQGIKENKNDLIKLKKIKANLNINSNYDLLSLPNIDKRIIKSENAKYSFKRKEDKYEQEYKYVIKQFFCNQEANDFLFGLFKKYCKIIFFENINHKFRKEERVHFYDIVKYFVISVGESLYYSDYVISTDYYFDLYKDDKFLLEIDNFEKSSGISNEDIKIIKDTILQYYLFEMIHPLKVMYPYKEIFV